MTLLSNQRRKSILQSHGENIDFIWYKLRTDRCKGRPKLKQLKDGQLLCDIIKLELDLAAARSMRESWFGISRGTVQLLKPPTTRVNNILGTGLDDIKNEVCFCAAISLQKTDCYLCYRSQHRKIGY